MSRSAAVLLILALATSRTVAQSSSRTPEDSLIEHQNARRATRNRPTWDRKDLFLGGSFVLGALGVAAVDAKWGGRLQAPKIQGFGTLRSLSKGASVLGDPGALVLTSALYAGGRLLNQHGLADAGLHATEAVLLSGAITTVLKGTVGRARPNTPNTDSGEIGPDADRFHFGGGFRGQGYTSFPSGHTTVAFAAASAFTSELAESHPRAAWIVGPLLYGGATAVGVSRMYDNKHWASDVVAGAAVGTLVGRSLVAYQHAHRGNRLDRLLLPNVGVAPTGGFSLNWSLTTR